MIHLFLPTTTITLLSSVTSIFPSIFPIIIIKYYIISIIFIIIHFISPLGIFGAA